MKKTALLLAACLALFTGCGQVDSVETDKTQKPFEISTPDNGGVDNGQLTGDTTLPLVTGPAVTSAADGDTVTTAVRTGSVQLVKRTGVPGGGGNSTTPAGGGNTGNPPTTRPAGGGGAGGASPNQTNPPATSIHNPVTTTTVTTTPVFDPAVVTKDNITCSIVEKGVEVVVKDNDGNEKTQLIELDPKTVSDILMAYADGFTKDSQRIVICDFDFDGKPDIFIPTKIEENNTYGIYKHYDEASGNFTEWNDMEAINGYATVDEETKTIIYITTKNDYEFEKMVYQWQDIYNENHEVTGTNLVPFALVKQYRLDDSEERMWDIYVDYCEFPYGVKTTIKREKLIFNETYEIVDAEEIEITWEI